MSLLTFIYILGAAALGFIFGMILELMLDARTIRELQEDNRKHRLTIRQLELENRAYKKIEVIEITDKSVDPQNVPDYSGEW